MRVRVIKLLLVAAFGLVACGGNTAPMAQPTGNVVVQSRPITDTPIPPPAATYTPVLASATPITRTPPELQPTSTSPATRTRTTPTPGPSPTSPLGPTWTPAPLTYTPTAVPALAGLEIEYFTAENERIAPGDNVTLFWKVNGTSSASIYRVDEEGERQSFWEVNATGSITVSTRPEDGEVSRFLLTAENSEAYVEQPLLVPLECQELWFFSAANDEVPSCPATAPQPSRQAEQLFQTGRMIWVEGMDRIYVIFEDGGSPSWTQYTDDFEDGDQERDDSLVPPQQDLYQPIRGFGLVWRSYPRVQERLGWALTPELAFDGMYQSDVEDPSIATLYLQMQDGGILELNAETDEWDIILLSSE
ncbi:MAG: hypothetical protein GYB65_19210 [Chloroflexi bacterium]|nr:hypothetical protein [Chloroflexota bacterium]